LADLEVEHHDTESHFYYIRYAFENGDGHLVVATTRPETLLGDTAVAVNPEDDRYRDLSGMHVLLPVLKKPIPVIFDTYVDQAFGTGALKITPAHDANDFEIGNFHQLERIKVIDEDGKMNELAGPYKGMDRFECREKILADLEEDGLLERVESYQHAVGHCYRCKTMIEPLLSKQWFVKAGPLAEAASKAVGQGNTRIYPANWEGVYFEWMDNIKDWCVSRQIWWGHRIPAWYCQGCGEVHVAKEAPVSCGACGSKQLIQETDVLDTWFSSALWPFSTLGWPEETDELRTFYPTSVLITGFDILFFWVARMMMMGLHFMGDVPFKEVYIHALVRDKMGKKMSKSFGNVIDPLEVMDEFGTDAFRFTLAAMAAQGRDIKLSEERISGYRHFVNKLWNASRLVLMNLQSQGPGEETGSVYSLPERWILSKLHQVSNDIARALEDYRFNDAAGLGYQFLWHEFCDWYLEMAKQGLYGDDEEKRESTIAVSQKALLAALRLLHPFMPFVTEEIWQKFPGTEGSIMHAKFPEADDFMLDKDALEEMELIMGVVTGIRNIRGEMGIPPGKKVSIVIDVADKKQKDAFYRNVTYIQMLAKVDDVSIGSGVPKPEASATAIFGQIQAHVLLKGLLDFQEERKRLKKEMHKIEKEMQLTERKLSNRGFLEKAPKEIVAEVREKAENLYQKSEKLKENLSFFEKING
jgi:valyl-tRNA synthetase